MYIIFSINLTNACLAPNLVLQEACPGSCRGERKEERPCTKSASTAAAGRARCWRAASSPPPWCSKASSSSPCPLSVSSAAALETERGHGDDELAFEHQGGGEDAARQHRALPAAAVDADFVHGLSSLRSPRQEPGQASCKTRLGARQAFVKLMENMIYI